MSPPHLDDEQLSSLLDGDAPDPHASGCPACSSRLAALDGARRLVASAVVPPLDPGVVDSLVATALAAAGGAPASSDGGDAGGAPLDLASRRRRTPPAAWLAAAAAAVAVLAGVAGLGTRVTEQRVGDNLASGGRTSEAATDSAAVASVVGDAGSDLGEFDDPDLLVAAISAREAVAGAAGRTGGGDAFSAGTEAAPPAAPAAGARTEPGPVATPAPGPVESAPAAGTPAGGCRGEAERIGAGRLGASLSSFRVRWRGEPAEVQVFALTEPAQGLTRQALVLSLPACGLLADPRF